MDRRLRRRAHRAGRRPRGKRGSARRAESLQCRDATGRYGGGASPQDLAGREDQHRSADHHDDRQVSPAEFSCTANDSGRIRRRAFRAMFNGFSVQGSVVVVPGALRTPTGVRRDLRCAALLREKEITVLSRPVPETFIEIDELVVIGCFGRPRSLWRQLSTGRGRRPRLAWHELPQPLGEPLLVGINPRGGPHTEILCPHPPDRSVQRFPGDKCLEHDAARAFGTAHKTPEFTARPRIHQPARHGADKSVPTRPYSKSTISTSG